MLTAQHFFQCPVCFHAFFKVSHLWETERNKGQKVAQWKRLHLPMQETRVRFVSQKDFLEKEMATHYSILAWKIPWTEEPYGLQHIGSQKSQTRLSN